METNFEKKERLHTLIARERVVGDLKTLARDAEDLLKSTADDLSDKGKEIRALLTDTLERAKATCSQVQAQAVASSQTAAAKANNLIRGHPWESMGIAFGTGLFVGTFFYAKLRA
jgi:ElaB/YqjD/DUF883 family membrane-anchored ribosome-binding protein